ADMSPTLNGIPMANNKAVKVPNNAVLSFGKLKSGFRTYLGVMGGFKTEEIMQSRSMFKGITPSHVLAKDDVLVVENGIKSLVDKHASIKFNNSYLKSNTVEVFKGPEFDKLSEEQQEFLLTHEFS